MAFVKPRILAAAQSNPDAVGSRLENFLLLHGLNGPMSIKVRKALLAKCESGLIDFAAAELLNTALGDGSIVGTIGRTSTGEGEEPSGDQSKKVQELAFRVAVTSA